MAVGGMHPPHPSQICPWLFPCLKMGNFETSLIHDMKNLNAEAYCEDVYNLLHIIHTTTFNHAPLRKLSRKEMKAKSKPWLTKGLSKPI